MAKRRVAAAEAVPFTPTEESAPQVTETVTPIPPAEESLKPIDRLPDIREMKSIRIGPDQDSPRLRLLRNYRFNQIQIRSDEELPQTSRDQLKDAGWTERPAEGVWTKQLPRHPRDRDDEAPQPGWPTVVAAEHSSTSSPTPFGPTRACRLRARNRELGRRSDCQATK